MTVCAVAYPSPPPPSLSPPPSPPSPPPNRLVALDYDSGARRVGASRAARGSRATGAHAERAARGAHCCAGRARGAGVSVRRGPGRRDLHGPVPWQKLSGPVAKVLSYFTNCGHSPMACRFSPPPPPPLPPTPPPPRRPEPARAGGCAGREAEPAAIPDEEALRRHRRPGAAPLLSRGLGRVGGFRMRAGGACGRGAGVPRRAAAAQRRGCPILDEAALRCCAA